MIKKQGIAEKIIRNTKFNSLGYLWSILVNLFMTPYIIHRLGVERFGLWALLAGIIGYLGLLDFNFGVPLTKYISEYYEKKDFRKINDLFNASIFYYLVLAFIVIILVPSTINWCFQFFKVPLPLYHEALIVFFFSLVLFVISNIFSTFTLIQTCLQKMDITNKVNIALSLINVGGTVFFLEKGYGLLGLMVNSFIILFLGGAINIMIAFKILPELNFSPFSFTGNALGRLFSFGSKLQIARLEDLVNFQTDKLLISHFLGISLVSFYEGGSMVINNARKLPLMLISAILPAASEIHASNNREKLLELYARGTKYLVIAGIPVIVFVFANASLIVKTWLGPGYEKSVLIVQILAPCYMINMCTGVATSIALAMGRPDFQLKVCIFQLIANLALSIILIIKIGFIGVVIATLITFSISSLWFMEMFHKFLDYSLTGFFRKTILKPFIASIVSAFISFILFYFIKIFNPESNRLFDMSILVLGSVFFSMVYLFIILKLKYLDAYDKSIFRRRVIALMS